MIRIFRQCEFGCGTKIYVDPVPFYDGLKLYIPREEAVPRIHNCPKLWTDPWCFEENEPFQPDDPPPVGVDYYHWNGYDLNIPNPVSVRKNIMTCRNYLKFSENFARCSLGHI